MKTAIATMMAMTSAMIAMVRVFMPWPSCPPGPLGAGQAGRLRVEVISSAPGAETTRDARRRRLGLRDELSHCAGAN
ncbi:hypothetical protein [Motilibacter deserti]|uniref:Secreted protein n=1 Tax=Motilibacter deserti TaxID=2714956 RepID=A0ABX0GRL1_9ACTN|nr:hypothetical protein [Motilibacter deserti]NHC13497.1 hypothetical protein [Motilibacter deserti]